MEVSYLKNLLHYEPESGVFTWKVTKSSRATEGSIAGRNQHGYIAVRLDGRIYYAHRLAYLYMTGSWPNGEVDHIDRDRANNKWSNLREASSSQNKHNRSSKGVYWSELRGHWVAQISVLGKAKYLGSYNSYEEASLVYRRAKEIASGIGG